MHVRVRACSFTYLRACVCVSVSTFKLARRRVHCLYYVHAVVWSCVCGSVGCKLQWNVIRCSHGDVLHKHAQVREARAARAGETRDAQKNSNGKKINLKINSVRAQGGWETSCACVLERLFTLFCALKDTRARWLYVRWPTGGLPSHYYS